MIAPSIISADSTRFLGFIPAAPTKASLLFDMLVSCASIQGISWLEASGAIAAENTVLRLIADEAGLPTGAGGCFVSGGSAGNLSCLAVARESAKEKLGAGGRYDQCGWLQDKFGLSWQVTPVILPQLLMDKDRARASRAMAAMMTMAKLDIKVLTQAADGK